MIPNAKGYEDENGPRMVKTPWYDEQIPFVEAAEIGTEKVIKDHSTIGIVVTTDGSIGELTRNDYVEAEERVVSELKEMGKPFIVILNSTHPMLPETERLSEKLTEAYEVPVLPISVENMTERDIYNILREALYEFPVAEVNINMPEWIGCLSKDHWLKKIYVEKIRESVIDIDKLKDVDKIITPFQDCEYIKRAYLSDVNTETGVITLTLDCPNDLYGVVLKEIIGVDITSKSALLSLFQEYQIAKKEYDQVKDALAMVKQTGYGVATPTLQDMKLSTPEIIKQGSRYGVKLKAVAPSIHIICTKRKRTHLRDCFLFKDIRNILLPTM